MVDSMNLLWAATYDWLEIAERQGLRVDYDAEPLDWDEIKQLAELAGENPEDDELRAAVLTEPRECDTLLRPGDVILTTGPGGDVYFFRVATLTYDD